MFLRVRAWTAGRRAGSHAFWESDVTFRAHIDMYCIHAGLRGRNQGGILPSKFDIVRLSLRELARRKPKHQSEITGITMVVINFMCESRFCSSSSFHEKGRLVRHLTPLPHKMDRSRASTSIKRNRLLWRAMNNTCIQFAPL